MTAFDSTCSVIFGEATGGPAKTTVACEAYEKSLILRNGCGKMCAQVLNPRQGENVILGMTSFFEVVQGQIS